MSLYQQWIEAKEAERLAVERRREIEDVITMAHSLSDDFEGTTNFDEDGYKIKVVGRMNRKVDSDQLQEIAASNGLSDHLASLFRWKAEINQTAWKSADKSITAVLAGAITTSPGRPSYSIEKGE